MKTGFRNATVIAMSDRIIVMSAGQIAGTLEPHEFNEERILRLAVLGRESELSTDAKQPVELAVGPGT